MTTRTAEAEYLITHKTAEQYRSKGYEVILRPSLDFLRGMTPDMLVCKSGEFKVIEVKTRTSLAANRHVAEIARIVNDRPGWSFDLILVAEPEKLDSPERAFSFNRDQILLSLEEADGLVEAGFPKAAFIAAWSANEAALRAQIRYFGEPEEDITAPLVSLDGAVFEGILSRSEYDYLVGLLPYRNAIVHGFDFGEFDPRMAEELIAFARRMSDPALLDDVED